MNENRGPMNIVLVYQINKNYVPSFIPWMIFSINNKIELFNPRA
jgi:hypothetical protein